MQPPAMRKGRETGCAFVSHGTPTGGEGGGRFCGQGTRAGRSRREGTRATRPTHVVSQFGLYTSPMDRSRVNARRERHGAPARPRLDGKIGQNVRVFGFLTVGRAMDGVRAHVAGTGMTLTGAIVLEVRANISVEVFPTEKSGKSACMVCSTGGPPIRSSWL